MGGGGGGRKINSIETELVSADFSLFSKRAKY